MTGRPAPTPMDADRWRLVSRILSDALAVPPGQRPEFLEKACRGDEAVRAEVESLIEAAQKSALLDHPAMLADTRTEPGGRLLADHVALLPGSKFGPYQILRKLGEGGMGVVYHATDSRLGRPVALKLLSSMDPRSDRRARFAREARAASALNHPNVATIYEFDNLDGIDFIAMEYVDGVTLRDVLDEKQTAQRQLLEYARQTARAVAAAHAAGIVHRDLKPANIMIVRDGTAKVLDFGLAKMASAAADEANKTQTMLTRAGAVMGTPSYMSPEQVAGGEVDHRADIFAFGIILYEIVCGERPFQAPNAHSTLHLIATADPRPVVEFNPEVPTGLAALIDRCLKKKPEERLRSIVEAEEELGAVLAMPEKVPTPVAPSRRKALPVVAGALIAASLGGAYWFLRPVENSVMFSIEVRGQDGQAHPASFRDTFDSGTRFRLATDAGQAGYLYIGGSASVISGGPVATKQRTQTEWLVIEGPPGADRIWCVWSRKPVTALEQSSHTGAIQDILTGLQGVRSDTPIGLNGSVELRGEGNVIGAQVQIRHR